MKKLIIVGLLLFPAISSATSFCNYLEITAKGCFSGAKRNPQIKCGDFVKIVKEESQGRAPKEVIKAITDLCSYACEVQRSRKVSEKEFYTKVDEATSSCDADG